MLKTLTFTKPYHDMTLTLTLTTLHKVLIYNKSYMNWTKCRQFTLGTRVTVTSGGVVHLLGIIQEVNKNEVLF